MLDSMVLTVDDDGAENRLHGAVEDIERELHHTGHR